jgi:hypothetical protein
LGSTRSATNSLNETGKKRKDKHTVQPSKDWEFRGDAGERYDVWHAMTKEVQHGVKDQFRANK